MLCKLMRIHWKPFWHLKINKLEIRALEGRAKFLFLLFISFAQSVRNCFSDYLIMQVKSACNCYIIGEAIYYKNYVVEIN